MNHLAIIRILSILGLWVSGLLLMCGLVALALGEHSNVIPFLLAAVLAGPLGATVLLLTNRPVQKTRAQDGLAVAVLFWTIVPLYCAIPFIPLAGDAGMISAYYDSVSALTTTGHSVLVTGDAPLPASLLLWRAVLHLLGTVATITIAASILAALNLGGPGIHKSRFFSIPEGSFFDAIPRIARISTVICCSAVLVIGSLLVILGVPPREALSGAVSAISTGLVDPTSAHTAPTLGGLHGLILSFGLIIGILGLVVLDNIGHGKFMKAIRDPESQAFIGTLIAVGLLAFLAGLPFIQGFGWALSSLSTSGIALSDPARFDRLPLVLLLFPVLIGGSALSAAGGIKLARLVVLSKRVSLEFTQLGYQSSVQSFSFRGRKQSERTVMGVWVYLVGYIVACVAGILILTIIGLSFDDAVRAAIGGLSNSGHIIGGTSELLSWPAQIFVTLGMVLGRLEVIALLPVLNFSFWSR